tara:strand:+ start:313 stop:654 length:342 start_codon:yes stop_codon:yes gene_type:complete
MKITESRLRRIIRSIIAESNLQRGEELINPNTNINGHTIYIKEKKVGYCIEIKFNRALSVQEEMDVEYAITASGGTRAGADMGFDVRVFYYKDKMPVMEDIGRRWEALLKVVT